MTLNEQKNKQGLIALLEQQRPVLVVGAGSSMFVGYPSWSRLLLDLGQELGVNPDTHLDLSCQASQIKQQAEANKQLDVYFRFLRDVFMPCRRSRDYDDFHLYLVQLGFCGVVTTNYDAVLESAITVACANRASGCRSIDLCYEKHEDLAFNYLQSLSNTTCPNCVLHLHGFYDRPEQIILTEDDYSKYYRDPPMAKLRGQEAGQIIKQDGHTIVNEERLHTKVIWTLSVSHPLMFVGFSMTDPFFVDVLRIVRRDFNSPAEQNHYATMPYTAEEDKLDITRDLSSLGVHPIFYFVPRKDAASQDHSDLKRLISELADSVGVKAHSILTPSIEPEISEVNRRMLGL